MSRALRALPSDPDPGDDVAVRLYNEHLDGRIRTLLGVYRDRGAEEGEVASACVDAIMEIRRSGRHQTFTDNTIAEFRKVSEWRLKTTLRDKRRRAHMAPELALVDEDGDQTSSIEVEVGDALGEALKATANTARLREFALGFKAGEARFWYLTHYQGFKRSEAKQALGLKENTVRNYVRAINARLETHAIDLASGKVCEEFREILEARVSGGGPRAVLRDDRLRTHLVNCDVCEKRLQLLDVDLKVVAPLLPIYGAVKGGLLAAVLGGAAATTAGATTAGATTAAVTSASAAGAGGSLATAGSGSTIFGASALKAVAAALVIGASGTTAVVVAGQHGKPAREDATSAPVTGTRTISQRVAGAVASGSRLAGPAIPAAQAPVVQQAAARSARRSGARAAKRARKRAAAATARAARRSFGPSVAGKRASAARSAPGGSMASAAAPTGTVPAKTAAAAPQASSSTANQSFGLGAGAGSSAPSPSSSSSALQGSSSAASKCAPGVLGC